MRFLPDTPMGWLRTLRAHSGQIDTCLDDVEASGIGVAVARAITRAIEAARRSFETRPTATYRTPLVTLRPPLIRSAGSQ